MKVELPCFLVRDLLPSYVEGLTEAETAAAVKDHLEACEDCRERYEAMNEIPDLPDTEKEVDYLKNVRKRSRKRIIGAVVLTVAVALTGVCAKLFWIGRPCDGSSVFVKTTLSEDGKKLELELEEMNSASVLRGVKVETKEGVAKITARETLVFPLGDPSPGTVTLPLEGTQRVEVCGRTVWEDGLAIDFHTSRLLECRVAYVGNASEMGRLISNLDLDAPRTMELQTAMEPYGVTLRFTREIQEDRRFMVEGCAYLLLALVENLGEVHWEDPRGYTDSLTLEEADAALPGLVEAYNTAHGTQLRPLENVKDYGGGEYTLQLLRGFLGI